MASREPRYDTVGIAFFRHGYSVQTIAGHYRVDKELIEDKIRKYIRKQKKTNTPTEKK